MVQQLGTQLAIIAVVFVALISSEFIVRAQDSTKDADVDAKTFIEKYLTTRVEKNGPSLDLVDTAQSQSEVNPN